MDTESIFKSVPELYTKNYLLRGLIVDDAAELFLFMQDTETMKYITPTPVKSERAMKEEVQRQLEKYELQKEIPWVILNKENGELIGKFSYHKLHMWHRKAEMGVVIRKEYQRSGVMTEIMPEVLRFGFQTLNLNRIVGDIFAENRGSERLLEKHGFIKEGVLRQTDFDGERYHDTVVFSLLKPEYEGQRIELK
ncbi:GNAT family N-acetyltransferase [Virgibacillus kekensis]|uniref:GNAT family N-acetyltransferase n=1 Tax=Virgibacillus kekensis TaxID=202261 RepID=A0ABV9DJP0_9BACI